MKISVTETDISGSGEYCPLERCFKRLGIEAAVGISAVSFFAGRDYLVSLPLPPVAEAFVFAWDHNKKPGPVEFCLEIPPEVLEAALS